MDCRYYKSSDVFDIEPLYSSQFSIAQLRNIFDNSVTVTFYDRYEIHAIAGVLPAHNNTAGVYLMVGNNVKRHIRTLIREIKLLLRVYADTNHLKSFYTVAEQRFCRWVEVLGFTYQSTIRGTEPTLYKYKLRSLLWDFQ